MSRHDYDPQTKEFLERNRRERPRMSDITRAVEKIEEWQAETKAVPVDLYDKENYGRCVTDRREQAGTNAVPPSFIPKVSDVTYPVADKNTPASLLVLRFEIYDLLNRYGGDLGRTIKFTLMQEIERLFKEYTHS
jgi:hypothetical protein